MTATGAPVASSRSARSARAGAAVVIGVVLVRVLWPAPLGVLVQGVIIGSLTALSAFGLSLIYRSNRIINFAQADLGGVPAALAVALLNRKIVNLATLKTVDRSWPYWVVLPLALIAAAALGFVVERGLIRRFANAPRLILMVVTIGLAQILAGLATVIPFLINPAQKAGSTVNTFIAPPFSMNLTIGSVVLNANDFLAVVAVLVASAALFGFLRFTSIGVAIRACAERADRAALLGVNVGLTQSVVWIAAAVLSALTVLLRAGVVGLPLGTGFGPSLLLRALAAAVLARMESYPVMFAAAAGLGVVEASILWNNKGGDLVNPVLFGILIIALLLQRRNKESRSEDGAASTWRDVARVRAVPRELVDLPEVAWARRVLLVSLTAVALGLPFVLSAAKTNLVAAVLIYAMVAMSLVVLTGWSGEISLGQIAFVAIGAATAGTLNVQFHLDLLITTFAAGLAGAVASMVIGLPALRIRGLFLAVTSLAFALATSTFLLNRAYFHFLPDPSKQFVERYPLLGRVDLTSERSFYFVCLVATVAVFWSTNSLRRSRTFRVLLAANENPRAAEAFGIGVERAKLLAFGLSGFYAAFAGGLLALQQRAIGELVFQPVESLKALTMVVVGGLGSLPGAFIGAVFIKSAEYFNSVVPEQFRLLFTTASTGIGLITILNNVPQGLGGLAYDVRDRWLTRIADQRGIDVPSLTADRKPGSRPHAMADRPFATWKERWLERPRGAAPSSDYFGFPDLEATSSSTAMLSIRGLDVSYGQVQVLFDVSLEVAQGQIVALLGTNGAGKSTVLRAVSGLSRPGGGSISFEGRDIAGLPPHRIAELGIMQMPGGTSVFPGLTVAENLRIACWLRRGEGAAVQPDVDEVLRAFPNLRDKLDRPAGTMSGGQQQMLGLGMALIVRPRLLMIDELSLGLAPVIVEQLLGVLRELSERGTTIILVEQSVNVALTVADTAYFLEKGEVRFFGPTADLLERPDVLRSVYLEGAMATPKAALPASAARPVRAVAGTDQPLLSVSGVSKHFSGVAALTDVTFDLAKGEVLGIIGPNGAGKTTLFDVLSGFITPDVGQVRFEGNDVTSHPPVRRSLLGLSRSFQNSALFGGLTVHQTVMLALDRDLALRDPVAAALAIPAVELAEAAIADQADELIERLGITAFRDKFVNELSTGSRRIVDLACQIGLRPRLILFDEPSSGIAQREAEALGPLLLNVRDELGATLLVIEHDMPLLTSIADRLVALDQGSVVTSGAIEDVMTHPLVVASYLGSTRQVVERSGPALNERREAASVP